MIPPYESTRESQTRSFHGSHTQQGRSNKRFFISHFNREDRLQPVSSNSRSKEQSYDTSRNDMQRGEIERRGLRSDNEDEFLRKRLRSPERSNSPSNTSNKSRRVYSEYQQSHSSQSSNIASTSQIRNNNEPRNGFIELKSAMYQLKYKDRATGQKILELFDNGLKDGKVNAAVLATACRKIATWYKYDPKNHDLRNSHQFKNLVQECIDFCPKMESLDVSNIAFAFATLNHQDSKLIEVLTECTMKNIEKMNIQDVKMTAWAFTIFRSTNSLLFKKLLSSSCLQKGADKEVLKTLGEVLNYTKSQNWDILIDEKLNIQIIEQCQSQEPFKKMMHQEKV